MELNVELFWQLCNEYDIPISPDYDSLMFEDYDGSVKELTDDVIDRIFFSLE